MSEAAPEPWTHSDGFMNAAEARREWRAGGRQGPQPPLPERPGQGRTADDEAFEELAAGALHLLTPEQFAEMDGAEGRELGDWLEHVAGMSRGRPKPLTPHEVDALQQKEASERAKVELDTEQRKLQVLDERIGKLTARRDRQKGIMGETQRRDGEDFGRYYAAVAASDQLDGRIDALRQRWFKRNERVEDLEKRLSH